MLFGDATQMSADTQCARAPASPLISLFQHVAIHQMVQSRLIDP